MDDDVDRSPLPHRTRVSRRSALLGLAAVGGVSAANVGAFLYSGGWLSIEKLTPAKIADRFEQVYGKHEGFRRNHAKGVSVSGFFDSNGSGVAVSKASVFRRDRVPVTGRFSLSGGMPYADDANATIRGLGLLFHSPNGEQWRTAMVNIPVFPDNTVQGFHDRLLASKPLATTGQPDPRKMTDFLAEHPETAKAMAIIKKTPPASGFDNSTFNSLNAFLATNDAGETVAVRWSLVPVQPVTATQAPPPAGRDYLFDELISKVADGPLQWRLILTIGEPDDPTNDPTKPWPDSRRKIDVGTITIDSTQTEAPGNARDTNFDPLVLPNGLAGSDDPLLSARSAVYSQSFTRRAGEPKHPSAIDVSKERR
ncbi:catalase family peroxidase [Saccharopolyspora shandongensis]|uniref:catalase family peroxidase n=1 Tax=Saccharopolyspora shandongensis TaxID=418495 RepID=UPI00343EB638